MDELLLARARKGDSAAFEELVSPWEEMLWRLCWHYTRNEADAADCLQETMLKAWRSLPGFRGDCAVSSWLYRLCVSCCLDFLRKRKRRGDPASLDTLAESGTLPADPVPGPEAQAEDAAWRSAVAEAVDALPPDYREALILTQLEGRSCEEAASLMGVRTGTVKSRVNRARQRLKELLSSWREPSGRDGVQSGERRPKA